MARLDTHWHANPKVLALGLDGMGLHSWSISYCDAELTDGFIPTAALPQLPRLKHAVNRLVELGRWEVVSGGFLLHDYLQYNRSREKVLSERAEAKRRMQRARGSGDVPSNNGDSSAEQIPKFSGSSLTARVGAPGPVPGVPPERPVSPKPPLAQDADAQGAPPNASAPTRSVRGSPQVRENGDVPPKWEELAPGQYRGTPNGVGEISLLTARCPRCERSLPVAEVEDHECVLVPGQPVEAPPKRRRGGRGLHRVFEASEPVPAEVLADLERMERERPTPEQIAAEVERIGQSRR